MGDVVATVLSVTGQVWAEDQQGDRRPLEEGDVLRDGEIVVTDSGAEVVLDFGGGDVVRLGGGETLRMSSDMQNEEDQQSARSLNEESVDEAIAALEGSGDVFDAVEAPAAGLAGGGSEGGHSIVRLVRIAESLDPLGFAVDFDQADDPVGSPERAGDFGGDDGGLGLAGASEGTESSDGSSSGDTGAPAAPSISLDNDTGADDSVTSDGSYSVGNVEDGATVEYSTDGGNTWSTEAPSAEEGDNSIQVRQTDEAGNVSDESELTFTLDSTAPTLSVEEPGTGNDTTPTIEGSSDQNGGTVNVTVTDADGAEQTLSAEVQDDGSWSVDAKELPEGDYTVDASITDAAGNDTSASATGTVDTTAPGEGGDSSNSIAFDDADDLINASEQTSVTFTGTVEDGAAIDSIVISDGDTNTGDITVAEGDISVDGDGNVTVTGQDVSSLADGELSVTMTVTDEAGNQGSVADTATLDTGADAGTVSVNDITSDDVINAQEAGETIAVTGSASGGDIAEGDTVAM
ncbi:retention module-containing protein, partial [Salicola sp. Rm-C-2C1-2]|uniref:retention module-containing protein n=1 Tax=Salicola sp. Rm-C-2C1-2 TaxID=3141321 RepID=UPI0032E469E3